MSNSNNNRGTAAGGGLGILGVVEIVFIILKLLGIINWSWWIVLIPLWIDFIADRKTFKAPFDELPLIEPIPK